MNLEYLDFEQPIIELEERINLLSLSNDKIKMNNVNLSNEISKLKKKIVKLTNKIFSNLNKWQIIQLARHPLRPHTIDYINTIFTDFDQLSGDRMFSDDKAIIGGIARLESFPVMIIGHEKGRSIKDKVKHNFGMPSPEGYRKALRLMYIANSFNMPIITFIDTPGAYPGVEAEERGQAEAIAKNLLVMSHLSVPIICIIIGEGGSGGALAIGVGDKINMLQYSIYSVISPEGCATLLWKDSSKILSSIESMNITAKNLKKLKLIDNIINEPLGGAHKNLQLTAMNIKKQLLIDLNELKFLDKKQLLRNRYHKLINYNYELIT
ncbi:MAG: acetyl-CoA carboxylase carboxyl transferase subunit alpha [Candidatus Lightella neohaematopini]|nr:acetyl-CoA carboxylase carboxyl transferase subunit alpha [Candidatus Lightella neohaematopini]MCV2528952.1 acetyl-CoA carboxylase carboxyl transferase subunit alpha [Candidatus Lightella neohaematopini]